MASQDYSEPVAKKSPALVSEVSLCGQHLVLRPRLSNEVGTAAWLIFAPMGLCELGKSCKSHAQVFVVLLDYILGTVIEGMSNN